MISRSLAYIINRFVFHKEYLIAKSNYGIKFKFKIADTVGRSIYKHGDYEQEITHFVLNEIKYNADDIIIDVGANIGWYSLLLAHAPNKPKVIYAFEPDHLNYSLLTENIALNHISHVVAINQALSNKKGTAVLYRYGDKNLGKHSLLPLFEGDSETINTITLDDFFKENINQTVKLMKIDVEGYETQVLLGAETTLEHTENLIIELSPPLMLQHNIDPELIIQLLYNKGFKPYLFADNQVIPTDEKFLLKNREVLTMLWKKEDKR